MTKNLTAEQVFNMATGLIDTGLNFAEHMSSNEQQEAPMDSLFDSVENSTPVRRPQSRRTEPGSRRNDVSGYNSDYYAEPPYQNSGSQRNRRQSSSSQGNPYNYGYGYMSDPVPAYSQRRNTSQYGGYGSTAGYSGSRRVNTGSNINYSNNGTTSASYGMGNADSSAFNDSYYQEPPRQQESYEPYQSCGIPYDEKNYRFPDFGIGGGYR